MPLKKRTFRYKQTNQQTKKARNAAHFNNRDWTNKRSNLQFKKGIKY